VESASATTDGTTTPAALVTTANPTAKPTSNGHSSYFFSETLRTIRAMSIRDIITRIVFVLFMASAAFTVWQAVVLASWSEIPIVVVLSESMYPGYTRGDLLLLSSPRRPIAVGDICVFKVEGRDVPIVHRIHRVHIQEIDVESGGTSGTGRTIEPNQHHAPASMFAADDDRVVFDDDGSLIETIFDAVGVSRENLDSLADLGSGIMAGDTNAVLTHASQLSSSLTASIMGSSRSNGVALVDSSSRQRQRKLRRKRRVYSILTKGDNNYGDDVALYNPGQWWVREEEVLGRSIVYVPFVGQVTILMAETRFLREIVIVGLLIAIFLNNDEA
jgi:signal peptidase